MQMFCDRMQFGKFNLFTLCFILAPQVIFHFKNLPNKSNEKDFFCHDIWGGEGLDGEKIMV